MAAVTFNRALIFCLVASQTKGVAFFYVPFLVRRKVGVLVTGVAFNLGLMLSMGEDGGFAGGGCFQGDLGRCRSVSQRGIQGNQHAGEC